MPERAFLFYHHLTGGNNCYTMELMHKFLPFLVLGVVLTVLFYLPLKRIVFYGLHISGDSTSSCCNISDILSSDGKFDETASVAIFNNQVIDYPKTSLAQANIPNYSAEDTKVLGTQTADGREKRIEVSLATQTLRAWEGDKIVMEFPISSGLWYQTPTGDFSIWYKTRSQRMKGGSKDLGTFYDLANVPSNMFFKGGFAIHGAYWHNNFGHPMSHGCINSPLASAAQLFEWTGPVLAPNQWVARATPDNPGTRVVVR